MQEEDAAYQELFLELSELEENGIPMGIDGKPASPLQIAKAHIIREEKSYMRDYVMDDEGRLRQLHFYNIDNNK